MKYLVLLSLLFCFGTRADEVKVEINPPKPVAGEVFQAYFRIFTDSDEEPSINFSPSGVEVVDKSNQGVSTRTVYANGKLTVTREMTFVYDLVASKTGIAGLRDITVQLGSRTLKHPSININVVKEAEILAEVFLKADLPKTTLYVGEGAIVRYYLYSRVPAVNNLDVKKYPKLNGFSKRFLQEPERTERVSVDGQMYLRTQIYAAKLFPEKAGELKVDGLYVSATYPSARSNDPFSAFGMTRDFKTKTLNNETVTVTVKPLPEPVPPHFTGLVGKHEFNLQLNQSRLIVNEPLEVKLTVSGNGGLENMEAPMILKHQGLEEFETNGDLKINDADAATKTFDYTFLPKENFTQPATTITLSTFDPDGQRYVPVNLSIPEIVVAGGTGSTPKKMESSSASKDEPIKENPVRELPQKAKELSSPLAVSPTGMKAALPYLNFILAGLALCLALSFFIKANSLKDMKSGAIPGTFKKGDFSVGEFTRWLTPLIQLTGRSPMAIIKDSPLDDEAKKYFLELLHSFEQSDYSFNKGSAKYVYQANYFKQLGRYIENKKNESSSQSA